MNETVIYTCITGDYDVLTDPVAVDPEFDYVCFVKNSGKGPVETGVWKIRQLDFNAKDPAVLSRYPKINPHITLPEYRYSVWIDGNITIEDEYFYRVIKEKIKTGTIYSGMKHWARDCAYEEIEESLNARLDSRTRLIKTLVFLKRHNFPKHYGMYENNVIFRCHQNERIIRFDNLWWEVYTGYTHRDQILHPYCLKECGLPFDYLLTPPFCARNHWSLKYADHTAGRKFYWHRNILNKKLNSLIKKFI